MKNDYAIDRYSYYYPVLDLSSPTPHIVTLGVWQELLFGEEVEQGIIAKVVRDFPKFEQKLQGVLHQKSSYYSHCGRK